MGYSIAYNSGSTVPFGTFKLGNILMGLKPQEYTVSSGFTWYANATTPNDNYLIISDTYSQGWSTQQESKPTIWRSETGTTESFVSLVNQLPDVNGVTAFTDSGNAMKYLMDSGKYFVNKDDYLGIVSDGLVLNLDAGWYPSYSGSGTTWKNLKGVNNGTLINSPTFSSDGGGSIMFDGVDDYVTLGPDFGSINGPEFSYGIIFYWDGTNMNRGLMGKRNSSPFNQYNIGVRGGPNNPASSNVLSTFNAPDNADATLYAQMQYTLPFEGWYYAIVNIKTTVQRLYVNGVLRSSDTRNYTNRTFNITGRNFYVGTVTSDSNTPGLLWNNKIAIVHLYDRSLSDSEIQQNYNTLKIRFGL